MEKKRFRIEEVDINDIRHVKKNAHFMEQSTFNALVNNIRNDGQLSSVPFCVRNEDGKYTVISGNHRIDAAKMAGLTRIYILCIDEKDTTRDWMLATQLSHNSLIGQDDKEILKQIIDEIEDVQMKEYAHISNEILESVKDIDYSVELPSNEIVPITLMFVASQKVKLDNVLNRLQDYTPKELENIVILDFKTLSKLNEVTSQISKTYKIKSQALAVCKMIELCEIVLEKELDKLES